MVSMTGSNRDPATRPGGPARAGGGGPPRIRDLRRVELAPREPDPELTERIVLGTRAQEPDRPERDQNDPDDERDGRKDHQPTAEVSTPEGHHRLNLPRRWHSRRPGVR